MTTRVTKTALQPVMADSDTAVTKVAVQPLMADSDARVTKTALQPLMATSDAHVTRVALQPVMANSDLRITGVRIQAIIRRFDLGISCDSPPAGTVGIPYSHAFPVTGGTAPFTFAVILGELPDGLLLNPATGVVSGVPTFSASYFFTIQVTDLLGQTSSAACLINIAAAISVYNPPDLTKPEKLRLVWTAGKVRLFYQDTDAIMNAWIYDPVRKGWLPNFYNVPMNVAYFEEAESLDSELLLGEDGNVYQIGGFADNAAVIHAAVITPTMNAGNARATKVFGDEWLDVDPQALTTIRQQAQFAFGTISPPATFIGSGLSGRQSLPIDVNSGRGQLAQNARLSLTWGSGTAAPTIYEWQPWWAPKAEASNLRATDWTDAGDPADKWVQGCIIRADTFNAIRTVQIEGDEGAVFANIVVQHNGEEELAYSFPPFHSHLLRLLPNDNNSWLLYGVRWVFEPLPELATNWTTIGTSFGLKGWLHARDGYLPLWGSGAGTATLIVRIDGVAQTPLTFPVSSEFLKQRVDFAPAKGKIYSWSLTSDVPVRVFLPDIEVRVKSWGSPGGYQTVKPFGAVEGQTGAKI